MKISTKGRYGLRVMFDLALSCAEHPVSLSEIAARQKISTNYLEQLMILLKRAKLVRSVRGVQGGYMLSRQPSEITVGEVLIALEGSLAPTDCIASACETAEGDCVPRMVYARIYDGILDVVNNLTLQDMKNEFYADFIVRDIHRDMRAARACDTNAPES